MVGSAGDVGGDPAITTEAGIQGAVTVVAGQREVLVKPGDRGSGGYQAALHDQCVEPVGVAGEVGGDLAVADAEAGVQGAVGVVAGQRAPGFVAVSLSPAATSLPSACTSSARSPTSVPVKPSSPCRGCRSSCPAIHRRVAGQREAAQRRLDEGESGDHRPAVGLHHQRVGHVVSAEAVVTLPPRRSSRPKCRRGDSAPTRIGIRPPRDAAPAATTLPPGCSSKRGHPITSPRKSVVTVPPVQSSCPERRRGAVAGQAEVGRPRAVRKHPPPGGHQFATGLHDQRTRTVEATGKVGRHRARRCRNSGPAHHRRPGPGLGSVRRACLLSARWRGS